MCIHTNSNLYHLVNVCYTGYYNDYILTSRNTTSIIYIIYIETNTASSYSTINK